VAQVADLQRRAEERGRADPVTMIGADERGYLGTERLRMLQPLGERDLETLAQGGIDHCVFFRDAGANEGDALRYLDELASLTKKFPRTKGRPPRAASAVRAADAFPFPGAGCRERDAARVIGHGQGRLSR